LLVQHFCAEACYTHSIEWTEVRCPCWKALG